MYVVYRVPRGVECEELEIMGARPGDLVYLRPTHPVAPLSLLRDYDRGQLPLILGLSPYLEVVDHSPILPPPAAPGVLRRAVGDSTRHGLAPRLRLIP